MAIASSAGFMSVDNLMTLLDIIRRYFMDKHKIPLDVNDTELRKLTYRAMTDTDQTIVNKSIKVKNRNVLLILKAVILEHQGRNAVVQSTAKLGPMDVPTISTSQSVDDIVRLHDRTLEERTSPTDVPPRFEDIHSSIDDVALDEEEFQRQLDGYTRTRVEQTPKNTQQYLPTQVLAKINETHIFDSGERASAESSRYSHTQKLTISEASILPISVTLPSFDLSGSLYPILHVKGRDHDLQWRMHAHTSFRVHGCEYVSLRPTDSLRRILHCDHESVQIALRTSSGGLISPASDGWSVKSVTMEDGMWCVRVDASHDVALFHKLGLRDYRGPSEAFLNRKEGHMVTKIQNNESESLLYVKANVEEEAEPPAEDASPDSSPVLFNLSLQHSVAIHFENA